MSDELGVQLSPGLEVFKSKGVNVLNGWRVTEVTSDMAPPMHMPLEPGFRVVAPAWEISFGERWRSPRGP